MTQYSVDANSSEIVSALHDAHMTVAHLDMIGGGVPDKVGNYVSGLDVKKYAKYPAKCGKMERAGKVLIHPFGSHQDYSRWRLEQLWLYPIYHKIIVSSAVRRRLALSTVRGNVGCRMAAFVSSALLVAMISLPRSLCSTRRSFVLTIAIRLSTARGVHLLNVRDAEWTFAQARQQLVGFGFALRSAGKGL
jgi:hypothetical protein